ncbi:sugar ABC transporter permease [Dactylosporangium sp. NPDC006015]|uniref:carbohydrate ABC transporter permease n=1 Tax=Dactylosporangium sp. NPDC006015 TaxID=3154576 RepID=UPI0033B0FF96
MASRLTVTSRPVQPNGAGVAARKQRRSTTLVGFGYLAPALIFYGLFLILPFLHSVYLSFSAWDGISPARWVGLENYRTILESSQNRAAFGHAFVLIGFYALLTTALALVLVGIIGSTRIRGLTVFRAALFLPYVIAPVVTGVAWRWLLAPEGPINSLLRAVGLGGWARGWLGDFTWALPSVGLIGTWMLLGLALVLLISGVQRIPVELYEAARMDGAGPVREFFAVTLPSIRNEITVVTVLAVTAALRNFDLIYVTTQGGPGSSTEVPSFLVYQKAFFVGDLGLASAMGVLLTMVILVLTMLILRPWRKG